jgi:hypothetical protein
MRTAEPFFVYVYSILFDRHKHVYYCHDDDYYYEDERVWAVDFISPPLGFAVLESEARVLRAKSLILLIILLYREGNLRGWSTVIVFRV